MVESANRFYLHAINMLYMLDARTGALLHAVNVPFLGGPSLLADDVDGRLYVAGEVSGPSQPPLFEVSVLDAHTGRLLRTLNGTTPMVIDRGLGQLIVPCDSSLLSAICQYDTRTWRLVRRIHTKDGFAVRAVDEQDQELVATSAYTGRVAVLDARTGAILGTLQVGKVQTAGGRGPYALQSVAVDGQTGRAFIIDAPDAVDNVDRGDNSLTVIDLPLRPAA